MIGVRGFDSRRGLRIFLRRVQTGSGAHSASCLMDTGGSFPGSKASGTWSWPFISSCRDQECMELYLHPNMSSWRSTWLSTGTTLHFKFTFSACIAEGEWGDEVLLQYFIVCPMLRDYYYYGNSTTTYGTVVIQSICPLVGVTKVTLAILYEHTLRFTSPRYHWRTNVALWTHTSLHHDTTEELALLYEHTLHFTSLHHDTTEELSAALWTHTSLHHDTTEELALLYEHTLHFTTIPPKN
jgi:hypothetical protein